MMAAGLVVDASVVVEFLAPGRHGEAADRLMGGLAWRDPLRLFAPDLIFLEAANALKKLALRRVLAEEAADRAVDRLLQLSLVTAGPLNLVAGAWGLRARFSIYDAVYVQLALASGLPLVTTDRRLARAAALTGATAWPVDHPELTRFLTILERPK